MWLNQGLRPTSAKPPQAPAANQFCKKMFGMRSAAHSETFCGCRFAASVQHGRNKFI